MSNEWGKSGRAKGDDEAKAVERRGVGCLEREPLISVVSIPTMAPMVPMPIPELDLVSTHIIPKDILIAFPPRAMAPVVKPRQHSQQHHEAEDHVEGHDRAALKHPSLTATHPFPPSCPRLFIPDAGRRRGTDEGHHGTTSPEPVYTHLSTRPFLMRAWASVSNLPNMVWVSYFTFTVQ